MTRDHETICDMFSYMRPAGGKSEAEFVQRFLKPLGFKPDVYGNQHLQIGNSRRVLFSSHSDTVHRKDGRQKVYVKDGYIFQKGNNCLGADDTSGVWLMTEMVKAKIPGVYVVHFGEERGGLGSSALAQHRPEFFQDVDIAIAFDRGGYSDVITHQMGMRCASDAFAHSLAAQLPGMYQPSDKGSYTDTAEYTQLVAECTNVSVGYSGAHSANEDQDLLFLIELRDSLLKVKWDDLVVQRNPQAKGRDSWFFDDPQEMSFEEMVREFPELAVEMLRACGIGADDFEREIESQHGISLAA